MPNILQQFIDLNTPNYKLYYVIGTIVLVLLISKYVSKHIARIVLKIVKKTGRTVNDKAYFDLLVTPLQRFLVLLVVIISLEKLQLPDAVAQYHLYGKTIVENLLHTIAILILIISFIKLLLRTIDFIATILEAKANKTIGQDDNQLIIFFKDFFKVILVIVGFLLILKFSFGQNIGNLLTGLSIVGAAIALATKESLENLIASFVIFFDKPFVTGDTVKVQNITGQIERIGLRSTRIRTDEKTYVTVPNKQMVDSIVDNYSLRTKRKVTTKLDLDKKTSTEKIKALLALIEKDLKANENITEYTVALTDVSKLGYTVLVEYFTEPIKEDELIAIKQSINLNLLDMLTTTTINLAGVAAAT